MNAVGTRRPTSPSAEAGTNDGFGAAFCAGSVGVGVTELTGAPSIVGGGRGVDTAGGVVVEEQPEIARIEHVEMKTVPEVYKRCQTIGSTERLYCKHRPVLQAGRCVIHDAAWLLRPRPHLRPMSSF
jgi:hypothetical protein